MDKENSGNLDDILKLLKNTVENTDSAPSDILGESDTELKSEPINAELLKEKLREQFMTDSNIETDESTESGEYTIDSDLISEFYEEVHNSEEVQETSEEQEVEPLKEEVPEQEELSVFEQNDNQEELDTEPKEEESAIEEGEIVEIVIPWVEQMIEKNSEESIPEDFGGELNEDYFDEEVLENSYVCFADEEVNDEEFFEQDAELEDEGDLEYDLPWYDDIPSTVREEIITKETAIEKVLTEELSSLGESSDIILPIDISEIQEENESNEFVADDDENELFGAGDEFDTEDNSEQLDIDDIFTSEKDEDFEDNCDSHEYDIANEKTEEHISEASTVEDTSYESSVSFYRTIIDARTERENTYGYLDGAEDNTLEVTQNEDIVEDIDVPEFKYTAYVAAEENGTNGNSDTSAEKIEDFYGSDENYADFDEDKVYDDDGTPVFDCQHEDTHNEALPEIDNIVWRIVKPVLMSIIALAILVLELLPILNIVPDGILDYTSYPWTYIFIDAQLLIFAVALCYNKLIDGLLKLAGAKADIYSVLSVTVIITLLGSIISCFGAGDDMPKLYNFISVAYLLTVCLIEIIDRKRIKDSIHILSEGSVFTFRRSQGKNSCAEKMYAGGVDPDTSILEPAEVESDNFESVFLREKNWDNKRLSDALIVSSAVPIAIFAIVMSVISIVTFAGFITTVNTFSFVFVLLAPMSATIAYYLPIFISHHRLSKRGCVIAGYAGAEGIADCDAVVFGDGHLFKDCNAKEAGIKLYCDESKTRELFVCLGSIYSKIGGPMENTFSSILGDEEHKVNMIRITRSGFEAVVDNKTNIIVGSSEYLSRYGIVTDRSDVKTTGVIYAAMNSLLCAKISVLYKTQPLFEELNYILEDNGVRSVIETYDPMISGRYVAKCRGDKPFPVSVVHKNVIDYNSETKEKVTTSKTGAFVISSRLKLVELLAFCKGITKLKKINTALLIASYSVAAVICILLSFFGKMEEVNLLWAILYQMIFVVLYATAAIKILPLSFDALQAKKFREEMKKREKENKIQYE